MLAIGTRQIHGIQTQPTNETRPFSIDMAPEDFHTQPNPHEQSKKLILCAYNFNFIFYFLFYGENTCMNGVMLLYCSSSFARELVPISHLDDYIWCLNSYRS